MKLFDAFMADPENEENKRAVEEAEAAHAAYDDYLTFRNKGKAQPEYLKATDFMDILSPRLRYFNACRAKT
eukprot:4012167-Lingulodinium_polyedra.AAC.1